MELGTFSNDLLNATSKANSIDFSNSILYSNATVSVFELFIIISSLHMLVYQLKIRQNLPN